MFKYACISLLIIFSTALHGQLDEHFDEDSIIAPRWHGDVNDFSINSGRLQLDADSAGLSRIYTALDFPDSISWTVSQELQFHPSGSNKVRIYLMLDSTDLSSAYGFFIEIGDSGQPDPICLHIIEDGVEELLGCSSPVFGEGKLNLAVTLNHAREWNLFTIEHDNTVIPILSLSLDSLRIPKPGLFGLECVYTNSRVRHFFFDNVIVKTYSPDTTPPQLISSTVETHNEIQFKFNEQLQTSETLEIVMDPSISGFSVEFNNSFIDVHTDQPLTHDTHYTVTLNKVADITGNNSDNIRDTIQYVHTEPPQQADIIIHEILADPEPSIGLPKAEYVEIHNRGRHSVRLDSIEIRVNSKPTSLPRHILRPGEYILISNEYNSSQFAQTQSVVLCNLPALPNSEGKIELIWTDGLLLHSVNYSSDWHEQGKSDGGWALEMINSEYPCKNNSNWSSSQALSGGTPGSANSFLIMASDVEAPRFRYSSYEGTTQALTITFDEVLQLSEPPQLTIEPYLSVDSITLENTTIKTHLQDTPVNGQEYLVRLTKVGDCLQNLGPETSFHFQVPEEFNSGDVVINELLYDPENNESPFIEIYNTSNKYIRAADLGLIIEGSSGSKTTRISHEIDIKPAGIVAFTENPGETAQRYGSADSALIIGYDLPSMSHSSGTITLFETNTGEILDTIEYSDSVHHSSLQNTCGVSLERISPMIAGSSINAWHSAAQASRFGTPGEVNSQILSVYLPSDFYTMSQRLVTANGDGKDDFLAIAFSDSSLGMIGNVRLYSEQGQLMASLLDYELMGSSAIVTWDGTFSHAYEAVQGIYIILIELIDSDGTTYRFKEPIALADRH